MTEKKSIEDYTYEEAIAEIEEILAKMESGNVPLDQSMKNFEEGMKLVAHCEKLLNSYERRISKVMEDREGNIMEIDMEQQI